MGYLIYLIIFLAKVVENALGTLRLIVVANGKKKIGALLQFMIAVIWITVTGVVIVGINEDPFKIVFFALGSGFGSFMGSVLEEKMAIGSNALNAIIDEIYEKEISSKLREMGFAVTSIDAHGKDKNRKLLIIITSRRKRKKVVDIIEEFDNKAMIFSENTTGIIGGYMR